MLNCQRPPAGWYCSLSAGHDGPCPTWPVIHTVTLLTRIKSVFCKHRWRFIGPDKQFDRFECMKCFKKTEVSVGGMNA